MTYRDITCEVVKFTGHNGEQGEAYYTRPAGPGPFPGVVLIHHVPGWNEFCIEAARKLAHHGFATICNNLYFRMGDGDPDDIGARARAEGGISDEQMLGDVAGAMAFLRAQSNANGKVGIIGFCSGGRQTYLSACRLPDVNAAVDCWGGRVMADPAALTAKQPVAPIDYSKDLNCPMLGLFGNDDKEPAPEQVNKTEAILKDLGKTFEFHRYDGAGHAFFDWSRPSYRPEQAMDGWKKVLDFFHHNLG
jgi:carboxymethylenebutenolidase